MNMNSLRLPRNKHLPLRLPSPLRRRKESARPSVRGKLDQWRIRRRYRRRRPPIHIARGLVSMGALFSFTFAMLPVYYIATAVRAESHASLQLFYLRALTRILNVRVHVTGHLPAGALRAKGKMRPGPFLFAANHASWLDIPVLGSIMPMQFMALASLNQYAGFGFMARRGRSHFVSGEQKRGLMSERAVFESQLRAGATMAFFPEARIGKGSSLYQFRSSFMGLTAEDGTPFAAIPVSISYAYVHGMPMHRRTRSRISWRGDSTVRAAIWNTACLGALDVVVEFHPPLPDERGKGRREIAQYCRGRCARGLERGLRRWQPPWLQQENFP